VGTSVICYLKRHTIEHSEDFTRRSKSASCACKFPVQAKALYIYKNSSKDEDDDNGLASSQRHKCHNIKMIGEAASADTVAAENFFTALQIYKYV
jgi:hypothetical protein